MNGIPNYEAGRRMNILHIALHMGDGAGKAISGLARTGSAGKTDVHRVLLLDRPMKLNHIQRCAEAGVEVLTSGAMDAVIADSDVVVVSYWASETLNSFMRDFPAVPCRLLLWYHNNGVAGPKLPKDILDMCDRILVTTRATLEAPRYQEKSALVYGFGDFEPSVAEHKTDYSLCKGKFVIGYVGTASYKRLPDDFIDYCGAALNLTPECRFVFVGETSEEMLNLIIKKNLERYITFPGWVSDVSQSLLSFDVFGYLMRPDTTATTENSVLEAMAAGLPILISRDPVGEYLIERNMTGFLVDSPANYGKAIQRMYQSESLRACMGAAARAHVISHYRVDENLLRFNDTCRDVMRRPKYIHHIRRGVFVPVM
jgi:glycosyltransferase involved in cell wall biosynthesis